MCSLGLFLPFPFARLNIRNIIQRLFLQLVSQSIQTYFFKDGEN